MSILEGPSVKYKFFFYIRTKHEARKKKNNKIEWKKIVDSLGGVDVHMSTNIGTYAEVI